MANRLEDEAVITALTHHLESRRSESWQTAESRVTSSSSPLSGTGTSAWIQRCAIGYSR